MKSKKKVLGLLVCAVLLVVGSVMGTMAWLTKTTDVATNTFSTGNVEIALDEADVTEYGEKLYVQEDQTLGTEETAIEAKRVLENEYKLIPGHDYVKDPKVEVLPGSEECYLFVKVVNPIADIEAATTIADQMAAKGWSVIDAANGIYAYANKVTEGTDVWVFESFTVADNADVEPYKGTAITIQAYAVQADGFTSAAAAWEKAPCSEW